MVEWRVGYTVTLGCVVGGLIAWLRGSVITPVMAEAAATAVATAMRTANEEAECLAFMVYLFRKKRRAAR